MEKSIKYFLIVHKLEFRHTHDLSALLPKASRIKDMEQHLKDVSFIMDLYSAARYPGGDSITKEDASKALQIAQKIYSFLME